MSDDKHVYIVMDGHYEGVVSGVFTDYDTARRYADALREGYVSEWTLDEMAMADYPYQVDYYVNVNTIFSRLSMDKWDDDIVGDSSYYIVYVRAKNQRMAEELGKARILKHLGIEESKIDE